jgi:hypothetical protein
MIFVAIIPSCIWIALLLVAWATLAYLALIRLSIRHWAMSGLLVAMAVQALAGMSVAVATSLDRISVYACLMGAYGALGSVVLSLLETAVLVFLSTIWPRSSEGGRQRFATWVSMWVFFSLITFLTHVRSAALCTV